MNTRAQLPAAYRTIGDSMTAVVVEDPAKLSTYLRDWEGLAASALEPNVFYEPWMLLPALRAYGRGKSFKFLFVFASNPARPRTPLLCGFFPLEHRKCCQGLPVNTLGLWQHAHCYLAAPLLRAEFARPALGAFFDWLAKDQAGCPLLELGLIPAEGPFHRLLLDQLRERAPLTFAVDCWTRALLRPLHSAEVYLQAAVSGSLRRTLKRKKKRLSETGNLRCQTLAPAGDLSAWLEDFLRLEASGWKGRQGTALDSNENDRSFFLTVATEAFQRGRLAMLALRLDDRLIACRCNFLASAGAFSFKSAFSEDFAAYSPGVLLEIENIHLAHATPGLRWMDSCTNADNAMINRLWQDRLALQNLVLATGKMPGNLAVSVLPLLRWLKRTLRLPLGRRRDFE
jgi:hypothetical protein